MAARPDPQEPPWRPCPSRKYYPPKFFYKEQPTLKMDYFLVLDFEGVINKDKGCPNVMEIIEFPVLKINAQTLQTESEFHTYVQPTIHPKLNPIATEITGITQDMVDGQPLLPEVLAQLDVWVKTQGLLDRGVNFCFVTCGDWDLKTGLPINCDYLKLVYPDYLKRWVNIKTYFQAITGKRGGGMKFMLKELNLTLDGRHHSGIDDSRNIAKILRELTKHSENLRNGLVEPRTLSRESKPASASSSGQSKPADPSRTSAKSMVKSRPSGASVSPSREISEEYKPPKFRFEMLPTEKLDYYLVLDFEANNDKKSSFIVKEIVEFPVVKVNARTLETESEFHTYVQPTRYPRIDSFITGLCGITQDMVDGKPFLRDVIGQFDEWMKSQGLLDKGVNFCFVTCGDWDLKTALPQNCDYLELSYPDYLKRWVNIKNLFQTTMGRAGGGMDGMLSLLRLSLDGRHHSGIDDSRNIAKILCELARRNEHLQKGLVEPKVLVKT